MDRFDVRSVSSVWLAGSFLAFTLWLRFWLFSFLLLLLTPSAPLPGLSLIASRLGPVPVTGDAVFLDTYKVCSCRSEVRNDETRVVGKTT